MNESMKGSLLDMQTIQRQKRSFGRQQTDPSRRPSCWRARCGPVALWPSPNLGQAARISEGTYPYGKQGSTTASPAPHESHQLATVRVHVSTSWIQGSSVQGTLACAVCVLHKGLSPSHSAGSWVRVVSIKEKDL